MTCRPVTARILVAFSGALVLNTAGCAGDAAAAITPEVLARYESMAHATTFKKADASIDCYLDFSTGMWEGMRATAAINDQLKNFLGGRSVTCYRIGTQDAPTPLVLSSPDANFVDLKNFKEAGSKLKVAIDRMTAERSRVSFFITDFERIEDVTLRQTLPGAPAPHPIDASAWAQTAFRDWLIDGNQIDIFAVPFQKRDFWFDPAHKRAFQNWIYTIVLTPHAVAADSSAFRISVAGFLQEQYRTNPPAGARHLTYNASSFEVVRGSKAPSGNSNPAVIVQDSSSSAFEKGYEFYVFSSADLLTFAQDPTLSDKRVIFIHLTSNIAFLTDIKFGIKVSDVTKPLAEIDGVMNQRSPEIKKDVETGKADTVANKRRTATYDVGSSDETTFDVVYNAETKELGVKLKPDFAGVKQHTIYRVDVVMSSAKLVERQDDEAALELQYSNGYRIRPLGESLHLALRDVVAQMSKQVIHTFYIDISP